MIMDVNDKWTSIRGIRLTVSTSSNRLTVSTSSNRLTVSTSSNNNNNKYE